MLQVFLIALGLSMDAFAVSVSAGICIAQLQWRYIIRGAFSFGFFQFFMPLIGWSVGLYFRNQIQNYDHWIAFALLAFIGGKMLLESTKEKDPSCTDSSEDQIRSPHVDIRDIRILLMLSFATSVDALAVGLSFSFLGYSILDAALVIGLITFGICLVGFEFGKRLGHLIEKRAEQVGGIILVGIGIKILVEHLLR
ncbi:MAG: manganese efflux pump MntP family protein [Treponemataceae bacterium]|nr:manganese efflux pump MntP family protein [Treponemataceae bacterium]